MAFASRTHEVADMAAAQEYYHSRGWTDGLPIVPPTADAVQALPGLGDDDAGSACWD